MRFHFDSVFYYVSDLHCAIAFYRDVLGFNLVSEDDVARFDVDGVLFELVPAPAIGHGGNARFCLRVDDLDAAIVYLRSRGVITTAPQPKSNGLLASFTDPGGNELCLWQYTK
jgi:predicted enzyme related to lactoylglutathione lyase